MLIKFGIFAVSSSISIFIITNLSFTYMDSTIMEMFAQPQLAEEWIERTKTNVIPWVKTKGKSFFDLVRFHGFYKLGVLEKCLSRSQFSKLLISTCKSALDDKDSESSLKYNMDVFPHKEYLRRRTNEERKKVRPDKEWQIDLYSDSHLIKKLLEELDAEYNKPLPKKDDIPHNTIKGCLIAYLNKLVDEHRYAKVSQSSTYGRYTPAISLEVYANKSFMDSHEPSYIRVFEIVENAVDESKVNELYSRYSSDSRIKLYIASERGFNTRTQEIAKDHRVSLVLVNPNYEVTDDSFVTPRSIALFEKEERNYKMLRGEKEADVPFVVAYENGVTNSLADVLAFHSVPVRKGFFFEAPRLTDDYIEKRALAMVDSQVHEFVDRIQKYQLYREIPIYEVEPDQMLKRMGYGIYEANLSDIGQLALIDFKKKTVTLDSINPLFTSLVKRRKYSLAHELGHAVLHSGLNVLSFGESDDTLSHSVFASKTEQQWLEHQANVFAASLLMPSEVVGYLYSFFYQLRFGRGRIEPLYIVNNQKTHWDNFYAISHEITKYMGVSIDALKYRMIKLKLLIIKEESSHIRDVYHRLNIE